MKFFDIRFHEIAYIDSNSIKMKFYLSFNLFYINNVIILRVVFDNKNKCVSFTPFEASALLQNWCRFTE